MGRSYSSTGNRGKIFRFSYDFQLNLPNLITTFFCVFLARFDLQIVSSQLQSCSGKITVYDSQEFVSNKIIFQMNVIDDDEQYIAIQSARLSTAASMQAA